MDLTRAQWSREANVIRASLLKSVMWIPMSHLFGGGLVGGLGHRQR